MKMIAFGPFRLDTRTLELWRDGRLIPLRPQPCQVLALLAARPGELVRRDELIAAIWPEGVHVRFDLGLNSCLKQVRAALGDDADRPKWIETLPRRGYRFLRSVRYEERAIELRLRRLLVLPFRAMPPTEAVTEPFAASLGDEVAIRLARMDDWSIAVLAGTALSELHSGEPSLRNMRDAGVDLALDCRVHAAGQALRIAAQLIDISEQVVLWADMYEGSLDDPFDTQRRVAEAVVSSLLSMLGGDRESTRLAG